MIKGFFSICILLAALFPTKSKQSITVKIVQIPPTNIKVINCVIKNGPKISPTYEKAVCTELVIGILKNFIKLSVEDKKRIRIISNGNIYLLRLTNSPIPKGVYYALTENGKGIPINTLEEVQPGDFVQFWTITWGHCGIVKSIDIANKTMELYSSFPSTGGYGIQTFDIPPECYFVRLK
ncbi:MAG: hypothetical protein NVV82_10375 [Sporocytophaga sp.]|nr:hypothetical protein [Sporocytophaga sp.]